MSTAGKKNVYICQSCKKSIVSVDVDDGVTPFMLDCKLGCGGNMNSLFYPRHAQEMPAQFEWFYPKRHQDYKGYKKAFAADFKDYHKNRGLEIRPAPNPPGKEVNP